jgi:dGTPase
MARAAAVHDVETDSEAFGDPAQRRLAAYAASGIASRGRLYQEPGSPGRSPFQRDRDRVIHASAFRRLTYKTQVFIPHEGDHYRTRLTHSLEVAQIARTIARQLGLDEDLAETLALAHDLGHPPFGHAGERALDRTLAAHGGFDHNAQSLRVVTHLEKKYAAFDGLNLSWETLEGLVKHNGPLAGPHAVDLDRPIDGTILAYNRGHDLALDRFASAEAQVAALADDIAYHNHDLDDGLRAGLIDLEMIGDVDLTARFLDEVAVTHGDLKGQRVIYEVNRRLITAMVYDIVRETRVRINALQPADADAIRAANAAVVAFSAPMLRELKDLRGFLFERVWRHPHVMRTMTAAEGVVTDLCARYASDRQALPEPWRDIAWSLDEPERLRMIVDYVAGMTDRFAIVEHRRLFDATPDLG